MPDSSINYTTTDPTGKVGAKFEGQIHARGLELDAIEAMVHAPETPLTTPDPNRIEWRDILNLLYTRMETLKVGNDSQFTLTAQRNDGTSYAQIIAVTTGDVGAGPAEIVLWAKGIGKSAVVRTLLDSNGQSDFQLPPTHNAGVPHQLLSIGAHSSFGGQSVISGIHAPYNWRYVSGFVHTTGWSPIAGNVPTVGLIVAGSYTFNGAPFPMSQASEHYAMGASFYLDTGVNHLAGDTYAQIVYNGQANYDANDFFNVLLFWWA